MKKLFFIILIAIILSACANAPQSVKSTDLDDWYHFEGKKIYAMHNNFVPLGGTLKRAYLERADLNTFEALGGGYAKDKNNVYYYTGVVDLLDGADPGTFVVVNEHFAKDKNNAYFRDAIIIGADANTFENISEWFNKDKNNVYLYDKVISNVDPGTFEVLSWTEAKDKNNTYNVNMDKGEVYIK